MLSASKKVIGIRSMVRNIDIKGIGNTVILRAQESRMALATALQLVNK